jgi:hypothetical protein
MKIKTRIQTYPCIPSECNHEWRMFGTRMDEEFYCPGLKPNTGPVICDKCGWDPWVQEYKIIGTRKGVKWICGFDDNYDTMVEIVQWGDDKTPPAKPVTIEWAWME